MKKIKSFLLPIAYCIKLSYQSSKCYFFIRLLIQVLSPCLILISAFLSKNLIDILANRSLHNGSLNEFILLLLIFVLLNIIAIIFNKITSFVTSMHNSLIENAVKLSSMDKGLNANIELFDDADTYNQFVSVTRDSLALGDMMWRIIDGISSLITFAGAFIVLSEFNWVYCLFLTVAAAPITVMQNKYMSSIYNLGLEQVGPQRKSDYIFDAATSKSFSKETRLFGLADYLKQKYDIIWNSLFTSRKKILKKQAIVISLVQFIPEIVSMFLLFDIATHVFSGQNTVGDYSMYSQMVAYLISSIFSVINSFVAISEDQVRIKTIKKYDKLTIACVDNGKVTLHNINSIEFSNVYFQYPNTDTFALKNISFLINSGEKIHLVGINGSGKTTIIKLILRLYEPQSGVIKINGISINEYTQESLRQNFSAYFQNEENFAFTIKENIILGDLSKQPNYDDILSVISMAKCHNILHKAPNQLETYISRSFETEGMELSDGEHQRVALARTFYRDCSVYLFDELSSSLDSEAENDILKELNQFCKDKIVIFTTHRMSNINHADKVIVIENGEMVEIGTSANLLSQDGRFSQLYSYQAQKYKL